MLIFGRFRICLTWLFIIIYECEGGVTISVWIRGCWVSFDGDRQVLVVVAVVMYNKCNNEVFIMKIN